VLVRHEGIRAGWVAVALLVPILGAAIVVFAPRCRPGAPDTQNVDLTLEELRSFSDFPVYWVGEEFAGYPLDRIIGPYPEQFQSPVLVVYGTCGTAFETGCLPPLVVKTRPGCMRDITEPTQVRGRVAGRESRRIVVEGVDVTVMIYASPELESAVAEKIVFANESSAFRRSSPWLPCDLEKLHPTRAPEPQTPSPMGGSSENQPHVATVFSAFGEFQISWSFEEAEAKLGWRVVRSDDPRFTLENYGIGALRKFKNSLFRLEQQRYQMVGHSHLIHMGQEPESYPDVDRSSATTETIGQWTGEFQERGDSVQFVFWSGESVNGQRIRVWVEGGRGYTPDEIRAFVETLDFGP
jgi:hypothetical protein